MKTKFLHITALILIATFTLTVAGININYHLCGKSGETTVSLDKAQCACEIEATQNLEDTSCCNAHENNHISFTQDNECCQDNSAYLALNTDFIFSFHKVISPSENRINSENSNDISVINSFIEKRVDSYMKKIKNIPRSIFSNIIKLLLNTDKDKDNNNPK